MKRIFNWRETKWWYIGTVVAVLVGFCASFLLPTLNIRASGDFVSIDVSVDVSASLKPPEQPFRNQSQAISVTSLGTAINDKATAYAQISGSWSVAVGDYVIVCSANNVSTVPNAYSLTGGTWDTESNDASASRTAAAVLITSYRCTGAGTLTIVTVYPGASGSLAISAYLVTGLANPAVDKVVNDSSGSGTTASAGPTATLTQADEICIAVSAVNDEVDDAHGSITTGATYVSGNEQFAATNGGSDSTNVQCHSVAEIVSATTAQNFSDGTHDSVAWAAAIATYKMAAAGTPAITVSPTSYDFGVVTASSTPYTTTSYFTIDNTSDVQTDQTISVTSSTWSGGSGWTHSDTATAGASTAGLLANKGGTWGTGDVIVKYSSPNFIAENQAATTDYSFGLKLIAPTSMGDGAQKTITVRVTAAAG